MPSKFATLRISEGLVRNSVCDCSKHTRSAVFFAVFLVASSGSLLASQSVRRRGCRDRRSMMKTREIGGQRFAASVLEMRGVTLVAIFVALAASAVGAGALDSVPILRGSDSMGALTLSVINQCSALHSLSDPIHLSRAGATLAENALRASPSTQLIAPMSRALGAGVCSVAASDRQNAQGMVIALDAVTIAINADSMGAEGIDYTGTAGDPQNAWREVLRLVYAGMPGAAGNNIFARDCNSAARQAIVNNWDNVFHGTASACIDSHPSVAGTGVNGYDQRNSIIEPGIRHAFRRDDTAGTTDIFLRQLGLPEIDFAQAAPAGSTPTQAGVYRGLANSPFCNNKRPDDDWPPVTLPANPTLGYHASQIPEMINVGVPTSAGSGLGYTTQALRTTNAKNLSPFLNEYTDQDPIRRKCVGRGSNAEANLPMEQVCGADGSLGVVIPIVVPEDLSAIDAYPSLPCAPGLGFALGPAPLRPVSDPVRCPNGDVPQDSKCFLPVRADASQPDGVAFDCINPPANVPQVVIDTDGDGSLFGSAPDTDGRTDVDGRVYNLILRRPDGSIRMEMRPDPNRPGLFSTPVVGAFYRIHSTRSLLVPPAHATNTCEKLGSDDQLACLTTASPCSLGYTGRSGISNNPGAAAALVNGIPENKTTIQALLSGGSTYPFAHKLYLNTIRGFSFLRASDSLVPSSDAEEELAKCFATLPFDGSIDVEAPALGLVKLPAVGSPTEQPACEDFDGVARCGDATNTDACGSNASVSGGGIFPVTSCFDAEDHNPCTLDSCNALTGVVTHTVLDGTSCTDGDACNGAEVCKQGQCTAGTPVIVNDGNSCTNDSCDSATGSVHHVRASAGTSCLSADLCRGPGSCDASGQCRPGAAFVHDDGDPCTMEFCDPGTGVTTTKRCAPVDVSAPSSAFDQTAWLYSGDAPVQQQVAAHAIDSKRAALLRGRVVSDGGVALPNARVSVVGHPEYGFTFSQMNGDFALAVNGGGSVTIDFSATSYLRAQRTLDVGWSASASVPNVTLVPLDSAATTVTVDSPSMQVA